MSTWRERESDDARGDHERDKAIDDELLERAARPRSGRTRTYAEQRAAGITTVTIRLDRPTLGKLDALCDDGGMSRADMIRAMIDAEWAEWRGLITSGFRAVKR